MQCSFTNSFKRDYERLSKDLQKRTDKQLTLLLENMTHPSLRFKKMTGKWGNLGVFEIRVTQGYRVTFQIQNELYVLRRVGSHDILRKPI